MLRKFGLYRSCSSFAWRGCVGADIGFRLAWRRLARWWFGMVAGIAAGPVPPVGLAGRPMLAAMAPAVAMSGDWSRPLGARAGA